MTRESVTPRLLAHLRATLREPALEFSEQPTPVLGGFDTRIFSFRLRDAPLPFSGPLILRVLAPHHDPTRVLRERATQNVLADLGYPAPRVLLATTEADAVGGPFMIMERLPGNALPEVRVFAMDRVMVPLQLRLHSLDTEPLRRALHEAAGFDAYVAQLERRIVSHGLDGLVPTIEWLARHRAADVGAPVICHGDFHPYNILMDGGAVTGVVDWANTVIADPEFDVATTKIILEFAPIDVTPLPRSIRWLAHVGRRLLVRRYLAGYARRRPLDARRLRYYEAAACLKALVRIAESRRRETDGVNGRDPLDTTSFTEGLVERVGAITRTTPMMNVGRPDMAPHTPRRSEHSG